MPCENCGAWVTGRFCPECGHPVRDAGLGHRGRLTLFGVGVSVVVLAVVLGLAYWGPVNPRLATPADAPIATAAGPTSPESNSGGAGGEESGEDDGSSPPDVTTTTTITVPPTSGAPAQRVTPDQPDDDGPRRECDVAGLQVGPDTTCAFAHSVQAAWLRAGGGTVSVDAYSPVTDRTYRMHCVSRIDPVPELEWVTCRASTGATVYFH